MDTCTKSLNPFVQVFYSNMLELMEKSKDKKMS